MIKLHNMITTLNIFFLFTTFFFSLIYSTNGRFIYENGKLIELDEQLNKLREKNQLYAQKLNQDMIILQPPQNDKKPKPMPEIVALSKKKTLDTIPSDVIDAMNAKDIIDEENFVDNAGKFLDSLNDVDNSFLKKVISPKAVLKSVSEEIKIIEKKPIESNNDQKMKMKMIPIKREVIDYKEIIRVIPSMDNTSNNNTNATPVEQKIIIERNANASEILSNNSSALPLDEMVSKLNENIDDIIKHKGAIQENEGNKSSSYSSNNNNTVNAEDIQKVIINTRTEESIYPKESNDTAVISQVQNEKILPMIEENMITNQNTLVNELMDKISEKKNNEQKEKENQIDPMYLDVFSHEEKRIHQELINKLNHKNSKTKSKPKPTLLPNPDEIQFNHYITRFQDDNSQSPFEIVQEVKADVYEVHKELLNSESMVIKKYFEIEQEREKLNEEERANMAHDAIDQIFSKRYKQLYRIKANEVNKI